MAKTFVGTGRRKRSIARVRMTSGKGKITINGRDVNEYLPFKTLVMDLTQPLEVTKTRDKFDIDVTVNGGGFSGQTGAIRLGIARALLKDASILILDDSVSAVVTLYTFTIWLLRSVFEYIVPTLSSRYDILSHSVATIIGI